MGKSEKIPLAIAAKQAFDYQAKLGNTEGETAVQWRHAQVKAITGREGLSDCLHDDFRPLMAHFQTLAGLDAEALATELRSGKVRDHGPKDDTHEERERIAHQIRQAFEDHIRLADLSWPQLLDHWTAESKGEWTTFQAGDEASREMPWPGLDQKFVTRAMDRKIAIEAGGGPLREGYLVGMARHKTRRPELNLGREIFAGLAERCTAKQLRDILSTYVNRIAAREGVGSTGTRNKKQRATTKPDPAAQEIAPRTSASGEIFHGPCQ